MRTELKSVYDPIGNRRDVSQGYGARVNEYDYNDEIDKALDRTYGVNSLNQYTRVQQAEASPSYPTYAQDLSYDADGNLTQAKSYGDANCDGAVNNFDIDAFVLAISDPEEYETEFPACDILNCDMNGDGLVNNLVHPVLAG